MSRLTILRNVVHNALMSIPAVQRNAMRFHSTGMNDDDAALSRGWSFYQSHCEIQDKRILELGPGRSLQLLERAKGEGAQRCVALDVVRYADAIAAADRSRIEFIQYDGVRFPLPNASFDIVWSSDVLEHVSDPAAVLRECYRVLVPGGVCIGRIDLRDHLFLGDQKRWLECLRYGDRTWKLMTSNRSTFVNRMRASTWEDVAASVGFTTQHAARCDVSDATLAHYKGLPYLAGIPEDDLRTYRLDLVLSKPTDERH